MSLPYSIWLMLLLWFLYVPNLVFANGQSMEISINDEYELSSSEKKLLQKNAYEGDAEAAYRLAEYYGLARSDYEEAMKWYEKAAKKGHAKSQYTMGMYLSRSKKFEDQKYAIYWFRMAANAGEFLAKTRLAEAYETGKGTEKDFFEAKKWYQMAALEGDTMAIQKLVEYLSEGKGGSKDIVKAYAWLLVLEKKVPSDSINGKHIAQKKQLLLKLLNSHSLKSAICEGEKLFLHGGTDGKSIEKTEGDTKD